MGICSSCESAHVATAKLVLQDERLLEFSYPVRVSFVLASIPTYFICSADEMEFDEFVSSMNGDEELQPGQLYFALPLKMASLAVKASSALMKSGGAEKCGCHKKLAFSVDNDGKSSRRVAAVNGGPRNGGRRKSSARLGAIPE
ncbi:Odorant receptor 98a [Salix suchowensis]|nr:Odorant receptor 98a [Salix suchowensis]